jgi:hypothetical protein
MKKIIDILKRLTFIIVIIPAMIFFVFAEVIAFLIWAIIAIPWFIIVGDFDNTPFYWILSGKIITEPIGWLLENLVV